MVPGVPWTAGAGCGSRADRSLRARGGAGRLLPLRGRQPPVEGRAAPFARPSRPPPPGRREGMPGQGHQRKQRGAEGAPGDGPPACGRRAPDLRFDGDRPGRRKPRGDPARVLVRARQPGRAAPPAGVTRSSAPAGPCPRPSPPMRCACGPPSSRRSRPFSGRSSRATCRRHRSRACGWSSRRDPPFPPRPAGHSRRSSGSSSGDSTARARRAGSPSTGPARRPSRGAAWARRSTGCGSRSGPAGRFTVASPAVLGTGRLLPGGPRGAGSRRRARPSREDRKDGEGRGPQARPLGDRVRAQVRAGDPGRVRAPGNGPGRRPRRRRGHGTLPAGDPAAPARPPRLVEDPGAHPRPAANSRHGQGQGGRPQAASAPVRARARRPRSPH